MEIIEQIVYLFLVPFMTGSLISILYKLIQIERILEKIANSLATEDH